MRLTVFTLIMTFLACCTSQPDCESISEEYSLELEATIKADNQRKWEQMVGYSYGRFDQAQAIHMVTGFVANFDSILPKAVLLKDNSLRFRSDFDSLLTFPCDDVQLERLHEILDSFILMILDLIDDNSFRKEYLIHDVYGVLDPILLDNLSSLCKSEFRIEKELFKGRLIEVEYMVLETLLAELDYTAKSED